jgi:hypothetical protein
MKDIQPRRDAHHAARQGQGPARCAGARLSRRGDVGQRRERRDLSDRVRSAGRRTVRFRSSRRTMSAPAAPRPATDARAHDHRAIRADRRPGHDRLPQDRDALALRGQFDPLAHGRRGEPLGRGVVARADVLVVALERLQRDGVLRRPRDGSPSCSSSAFTRVSCSSMNASRASISLICISKSASVGFALESIPADPATSRSSCSTRARSTRMRGFSSEKIARALVEFPLGLDQGALLGRWRPAPRREAARSPGTSGLMRSRESRALLRSRSSCARRSISIACRFIR